MATIRRKRPGVWEVRQYTGKDASGRPTQISRTVHGAKKDAQRVAAELTLRPAAHAGNRTVSDLLDTWIELNAPAWAESTRRDRQNRARLINADNIGRRQLSRLSVADVERWHARLRTAGVGEASIRNQHHTLRAALSQALRWGWVPSNVAAIARLSQPKSMPRGSMAADDVRRVLAAARTIEPAAELALRLAAVTGARRSELAALRWDDVAEGRLVIDSSVAVVRDGHGAERGRPLLRDEATKTANRRVVTLDDATLALIAEQRAEREQYGPWMFELGDQPPNPDRIGWWWQRARKLSGIDPTWRLHDLRHWSATVAIASGHDVRTVANRLGHASAAMTLRVYAHAVDEADAALATALGNMLQTGS